MPIGEVLNRCACAYLDHLLQSPNVHRGKSHTFMFQRLIVVCSRGSNALTYHAANIILSAFHFTVIDTSVKKYIEENEAISLLSSITTYASQENAARCAIELKGAQKLLHVICEIIIQCISHMGDMVASSILQNFLKKVISNFNPQQSLVLINKISTNCHVRTLIKPLFLSIIEFSDFPDLYASIIRQNIQPQSLVEIIVNFIRKEIKDVVISNACDPLKLIHYLVQGGTPRNGEVIQALAFLLYTRSQGPVPPMSMDEIPENLIDIYTAAHLCNTAAFTRPARAAVVDTYRDAIVRVLEIYGCEATETVEKFTECLQGCVIQKELVSTNSVSAAFLYMYKTTIDMGKGYDRGSVTEGEQVAWNGKNFVKAIKGYPLKPSDEQVDWVEILKEIDNPEVSCHWKALILLDEVISTAFTIETFPIKWFLSSWKNSITQLQLLHCVIERPSLFDFTKFPHTKAVTQAHNLKQMPDDSDANIRIWNMLEFSALLLNVAVRDADTQIPIGKMFEFGFNNMCADVIILALFQVNVPWSAFRCDLIRNFLPVFIIKSSNAVPILNFAWSDSQIQRNMRQFIVNAFASLYIADDQQRLAKILDVAHELKPAGLSEVLGLQAKHMQFVVELACLASKRDYLKIEKWLEDKEKAHGETVVTAVLNHIQKRYKNQQLISALRNQTLPSTGASADPINALLQFVNSKSNVKQRKQYPSIFQVMKENSGRSSSVSSTGGRNSVQIGPAVFGSGPPPSGQTPIGPPQDQRTIGPIQPPRGISFTAAPGSGSAAFTPAPGSGSTAFTPTQQAHLMVQSQHPSSGMNLLMNMSHFGTNSRDLLKVVQPAPPPPSSMSPSNQMIRSQIPALTQRQNSSTGGWHGTTSNRAPGPGTPQQMEFRQLPPGPPSISDFASSRLGVIGSGQLGNNTNQSQTTQHGLSDDVTNINFSEDIQEEANSYFEKIYSVNNPMPVDDLIALLKNFKSFPPNSREQKVLACVVKNLFEEYRFFHEYPDRELKTTAAVYGGIIREAIIVNVQFATAVRKVIESLNADPNTMLWKFGTVALKHCQRKLCSYPKVCSMIASSENFSKFPQDLKEYVQAGVKGELPADAGRNTPTSVVNWGAVARAASVDPKTALPSNRTGNSVLSYTNVDTLVAATEKDGAEIAQPVEAIVDKISFLFNNLSQNNLDQKKEEVIAMMEEHGEGFTRWLSQYIVMKRVSIEQNFQPLYNQFVQAIHSPLLDSCIKMETFRNIKILLRTDKRTTVASNYSDRQLLKNLGMWLGSITIARSKPILLNELDLKSLLLEAYYKGQAELLFVVPFISKILMSCSKSNLFTPSCAWIRSILKVLAELHNEPDLKINLKFEIEVLCKELNVDLNTLPIDGILKDTDKLVRVPQQLCDVKVLNRPDVPSPVPSQIRIGGSSTDPVGISPATSETKPSTPQPEGNDLLGPGGVGGQAGDTHITPNVNHFAYHDINVLTYDGLIPHVKIQSHLPLFQLHPHAKHLVRPALVHAIKELIGPVTERALKIAMTVTESMIRKDFAMDPDEKNMKLAAFHMMRAMTAGMAMITCRDPLASTMIGHLVQSFQQSFLPTSTNPELKQMIDEASQTITQDNVELSTNFIVKTACEKASTEIEKRLDAEYNKRIQARKNNEEFKDEAILAIQKRLPPQISIQPGTVQKANLAVYEQFSSRICGFKPASDDNGSMSESGSTSLGGIVVPAPQLKEMDSIICQMQLFIKEVDQTTQAQPHVNHTAFQAVCMIRELLSNVVSSRDPMSLVPLITRSVEHLLHSYHLENSTKIILDVEWTRRLRDLFIGIMRLMQSHFSLVDLSRRVTAAVIGIRSDYKWNMEGIEILLKQSLLQTPLWDQHLSASMDNGGNLEATMFAQKFFRGLGGGDINKIALLKEKFPLTCDQLTKLHQMQTATRATVDASNGANGPTTNLAGMQMPTEAAPLPAAAAEAMAQRGLDDAEMTTKVEIVLREWISLCYTPTGLRNPQETLAQMVNVMTEQGILQSDDRITQFFRLAVEMCVDVSVRMLKVEQVSGGVAQGFLRQRAYYTLDAFVKLMALVVRYSDTLNMQNKVNLLKKVSIRKLLNIVVGVLHMDHEVRRGDFNAVPYHRIIITLFNEVTCTDPQNLLEPIAWSILESFGQCLFALQPRRMPGFAYAWLDIVGHRNVIGRLLANTGIAETVDPVKTAATYTQLIISHLKFLAPFLRNIQLPKSIAILYKGTLRVLLVILHDFPELLCEFHYVICDTIPPNCVQLRNLVLSAYPRNMRLPDPFALNFKQVDAIPEMAVEPKSNLNMATIIPDAIRIPLDEYLTNRSSVEFLSSLPSLLQSQNIPGSRYNTTVMNALVLYVGIRAIESLHANHQRISIHTIAHTSYMDIFQNLAVQLCTEGRYLLFNGIANQLRYPNAHTHYFSCVFLFLFRNSDCDAIQEQITRILFERLVALRPHPWGLLITFIELIKNPNYNFWKFEFTKCAPEIERLFQNVANTCVPTQAAANAAQVVASGASAAGTTTTDTRG